ncbi:DNA cytosine methyltransferase [Sphingobacterium siyangense]|uniref:DNA cytosine methyltransferase n=1 Tax=Sphingobacterium siyangense TaxID=459529 RepID=UPI003DA57E60
MDSRVGIFSFFAGAGFLDLGFETVTGFNSLFVNEIHKPFMEIYKSSRTNLGIAPPTFGHSTDDVCSFLDGPNAENLQNKIQQARNLFDLVGFIGGPPCPDFSIGGKNKGIEGENGKLSQAYIDLILQNQPDFFLFENVKGLYRTKKHRAFFDNIKATLIKNNYHITERLINSIEYGAPQDRERIILIGFRRDTLLNFGLPLNNSNELTSFNWLSQVIDKSEDIFSKDWPTKETFGPNLQRPRPENINEELTVQYWFEKNDVTNHPNAQDYFQPRAGLIKFQTIEEGDDLKKSYKRLHRWRYSPTAAYGNNEVHLHPYEARRISAAEALAIQSLPKEYIIPSHISLSNMFKTIGNGVPYLAAKGLANTIKIFIESLEVLHKQNIQHEEVIGE